jgi:hypothetical protein
MTSLATGSLRLRSGPSRSENAMGQGGQHRLPPLATHIVGRSPVWPGILMCALFF